MGLRVPRGQVQYKLATLRFWLVEIRIALRERAEEFPPSPFEVEAKRSVESMSGLVAKKPHTFGVSPAFHFQHLLALEFHQARMGQIKRNSDARHAVRREPFFRKPHMWLKPDAAIVQFAVQAFDVRLEKRTFDLERQVGDAQIEQMLVSQTIPGKAVTHASGPFVAAPRKKRDMGFGKGCSDRGKAQLMTTVIYAGIKKSRFRISEARSL
jgi:hypothetical protein